MWVQVPSGGKVMAKACKDAHQASPSALQLPEGKSVSDGLRSFSFCRLWGDRSRAVFCDLLAYANFFYPKFVCHFAQKNPAKKPKLCAVYILRFAPFCDII